MSEPDPHPFDFLPNDPILRRICSHGVRQFGCTQRICKNEILNLLFKKDKAQLQASQTQAAPPSPPRPSSKKTRPNNRPISP